MSNGERGSLSSQFGNSIAKAKALQSAWFPTAPRLSMLVDFVLGTITFCISIDSTPRNIRGCPSWGARSAGFWKIVFMSITTILVVLGKIAPAVSVFEGFYVANAIGVSDTMTMTPTAFGPRRRTLTGGASHSLSEPTLIK